MRDRRAGARSRAAPVMRRSVARRSMRAPARAARVRRCRSSGSGRRRRASIALVCASSSAVIVAKSFACSTSRAEKVCAASRSMSWSSSGTGGAACGCSACARREGSGGGSSFSPKRPSTRRQLLRHHPLEQPRILPEEVECLLEERQMLLLGHEHRGERRAEIVALRDAHRFHRGERVDHLGGAERQARACATAARSAGRSRRDARAAAARLTPRRPPAPRPRCAPPLPAATRRCRPGT